MEIYVTYGNKSISISIENPFRMDASRIAQDLRGFLKRYGQKADSLNLEGLLLRMVRGVYGCEEGCPADAKRLVLEGFDLFELEYVEGGILSARCNLSNSGELNIKVFPEF